MCTYDVYIALHVYIACVLSEMRRVPTEPVKVWKKAWSFSSLQEMFLVC